MKHKFYIKTKKQQRQIQFWIAFCAFTVIVLSFMISWISGFYLLGFFVFPIVLSIIAPFFDTPTLKNSGKLTYHSLLFLSESNENGIIKLHGGTLFDYIFVIDRKMNGTQRTNFIIQQYTQGLLNLIEENENNKGENMIIRGTSYIINDRTAQRIGFKVTSSESIQKLIMISNFFNILITYSIAKGKLSFPKLSQTKTFETKINDLISRKEYIKSLNEKLIKHSTTT